MKVFTVYINPKAEKPEETAEFVPEAFSWWGFLFPINIFWSLYNRCWILLLMIICVEAAHYMFANEFGLGLQSSFAFRLPFVIFFGLSANDFWRKSLEMRGYVMDQIISSENLSEAQHRYFGHDPKLGKLSA